MKLIKIYSDDCKVCRSIGDSARPLADEAGFVYEQVSLEDLASTPSPLRDYAINYHVSGVDGMIDLPIYVIQTDKGEVQGSGVVETLEEVSNLIYSWKQWEASVKP